MKKFDTQTETKIGFKIMFYLIHNSIAFSFVYIILPIAWRHTTICAWSKLFSIHSHMATSYRIFWGLSLYMVWCTFSTQLDPSLTKVIYACFDCISYVYIYIDIHIYGIDIYVYVHTCIYAYVYILYYLQIFNIWIHVVI